jgi:hypothetical protein
MVSLKEKRKYEQRLFRRLTVSIRPLYVEDLGDSDSSGDTTVSPKSYEDLWPLDAKVSSVVRIVCLPSPHHRR